MAGRLPAQKIPRSTLRCLLWNLVSNAAEFEALCIDHFPQVHQCFTIGMDRISRTNLLLQRADSEVVLSALRVQRGVDCVDAQLAELQAMPSYARDFEMEILSRDLEALLCMRDRLRSQATVNGQQADLTELHSQIVALKRQLRRGPQLNEGEILGDRYMLLQRIGRGGYSDVWQAFDRNRQHIVAVKVLHGRRTDAHGFQRFERGARKLLELSHPCLARVLDEPAEHDDFQYYVMEYLHGGDLERAVSEGRISLEQALKGVLQAGAGLEHAHQHGFIHRDVKPMNILLDGFGGARLTDFDLVMAADSTGGTGSGAAMGTFIYTAPEVLEDARSADRSSDVYSLGMTLLFVLHGGKLPYQAFQNGLSFARSSQCPSDFLPLLGQATALEPSQRISSAAAFCEALEQALYCLARGASPRRLPLGRTTTSLEPPAPRLVDDQPDAVPSLSTPRSSVRTGELGSGPAAKRPWMRLAGGFAVLPAVALFGWTAWWRPSTSGSIIPLDGHSTVQPAALMSPAVVPPLASFVAASSVSEEAGLLTLVSPAPTVDSHVRDATASQPAIIPSNTVKPSSREKRTIPKRQFLPVTESCIMDPSSTLSPAVKRAVAMAARTIGLQLRSGQRVSIVRAGSRMIFEPLNLISTYNSTMFSLTLRGMLGTEQPLPAEVMLKCGR